MSGAEVEEDTGGSQVPSWIIPLIEMIKVNFILLAMVFHTYVQYHFLFLFLFIYLFTVD